MRIWYQSYVDYEHGKTYWDRLRAHCATEAEEVDSAGAGGVSLDISLPGE